MQKQFLVEKERFINKFLQHPVTREISNGVFDPINTENISETLNGYGNLYSFIGFEQGTDPIEPVIELIQSQMKIVRRYAVGRADDKKVGITITYSRKTPRAELERITEMEWSGESWLYGIEKGISGFNQYMNEAFGNPPSRSQGGVQVDNKLRDGNFNPVPYFEALLKEFDETFNK